MFELGIVIVALAFLFVWVPWLLDALDALEGGAGRWAIFWPVATIVIFAVGYFTMYTAHTYEPVESAVQTVEAGQAAIDAVNADEPTKIRTADEIQHDQRSADRASKERELKGLREHTNEVFDDVNSARCRAGLCGPDNGTQQR